MLQMIRKMRPRRHLRRLQFARLFDKYRSSTMILRDDFIANLELIWGRLGNPSLRRGTIVECGTWKGGMSAAMVEICGPDRQYYFFDSFEGLPPAKEIDGKRAISWSSALDDPQWNDNCRASLEDFTKTMRRTSCPSNHIHVFKGWFKDTFPTVEIPPIAILRLDGDWYDSTMESLDKFWDSVLAGGLILLDDYYAWQGCRRAVHDFLSKRNSVEPIYQASQQLAFLIKHGN